MAWSDTLLDASFKGVAFEVVRTDDHSERATVEHSYPYVDGADVEDMGRGARRISVEAVFYGDGYETRLQALLAVMDQPGSGEFVHPVFGSIKNAQAVRSSISHDADTPDYATLTINFIESTPANPLFSRALASQKAEAIPLHGAAATAAAANNFSTLVERLRADNPLAGLDALRDALTAPLLAITAQSGVVLSGLDVLAYPRAWANDITALVGGILDVREFGGAIPADWAGIQTDLNAFSMFSTAPVNAPAPVAPSVDPTEEQAIAAGAMTVKVNAVTGLASAASYVLASEANTPTLSPVEIEGVCNAARSAIEAAIDQARTTYGIEQSRTITEPLKDQGLAVQEAARAIIAARPPLIERTVEAPGNLRLQAHLWYGDHTRAAELYRLNGARRPIVNAGDRIHAYA